MFWSFFAVLFSGWLYVDASYRGPQWQYRLFKLLTLILLILQAWQAPEHALTHFLIITALFVALIGDTLLLVNQHRNFWILGTFFLVHLLYSISFGIGAMANPSWVIALTLLIIGILFILLLWQKISALYWPICTFYGMTLMMMWSAIEQYRLHATSYSIFIMLGAMLLLLANTFWLFSRYRNRFHADNVIIASCYFAGHFMIVRALWVI